MELDFKILYLIQTNKLTDLDVKEVEDEFLRYFYICENYYHNGEFIGDDNELNKLIEKISQVNYKEIMEINELAKLYAFVKMGSMYSKNDTLAQLFKTLRLEFFERFIVDGTLVRNHAAGIEGNDTSLLKTVYLYNLFEPEDLIVVSAFDELENRELKDTNSLIDLVLYCIDKREVTKAFSYYVQVINELEDESFVKKYLQLKISEVSSQTILHKPFGNGNHYRPLDCERFPKIVTDSDDVQINALTSLDTVVTLFVEVNGVISEFSCAPQNGQLSYDIGNYSANTTIKYWFNDDESFSFEVYEQKNLEIKNIEASAIYFEGLEDKLVLGNENGEYLSFAQTTLNDFVATVDNNILSIGNFKIDLDKSYFLKTSDDLKINLSFIKEEEVKVFGFGERYNSVLQEDETIDHFVYSQYKEQGLKTYIPIPIVFTSSDYGFFLNSYCNNQISIKPCEINFMMNDINDKLYLLNGEYSSQLKKYYDITGSPQHMVNEYLGPWMSSNNWDSQKECMHQLSKTLELDIPSTVFVVEQWSDEATFYIFNDAKYSEKTAAHSLEEYDFPEWSRWPNPKELVQNIHNSNMKFILWQIPIIKYVPNLRNIQKLVDEKFALENNYVVRHADGKEYRIAEDWFKDSLVIDFTNEEAREWWFSKRRYLLDEINIDGFKTDGGECLFGTDIVLNNMKDSKKVRNLYTQKYIESYYNEVTRSHPDKVLFSRASYIGAHTTPSHWAGDERSTFDAFGRSIKAGINAGLSGIIYWGWDLGGFSGPIPSAELFKRSTEMATFCPIMQYHAESKAEFNQDRTPWNIAERTNDSAVIENYKFYAHLRMQLIPYIKHNALKVEERGLPLMRSLFIDYPKDEKCYLIEDQYLFGESLLIAPIIVEGDTSRNIYLPLQHLDFFNLTEHKQGEITWNGTVDEIPVFVKENSVIQFNYKDGFAKNMKNEDIDFEEGTTTLFVYGNDINYCDEQNEFVIKDGKLEVLRFGNSLTILTVNEYKANECLTSNAQWYNKEINKYEWKK